MSLTKNTLLNLLHGSLALVLCCALTEHRLVLYRAPAKVGHRLLQGAIRHVSMSHKIGFEGNKSKCEAHLITRGVLEDIRLVTHSVRSSHMPGLRACEQQHIDIRLKMPTYRKAGRWTRDSSSRCRL